MLLGSIARAPDRSIPAHIGAARNLGRALARKENSMRYYTAGESHGQGLVAIVEDVPAGLKISEEQINVDLGAPPSRLTAEAGA